MDKITDDIKQEIWYLYFNRMYSYPELISHFKKKYTYAEIKKAIKERYEMVK